MSDSVQPWPKLTTRPLGDFRIFQLRAERKRSPRTGTEHEFFLLDCANWVNVCAVTPDDHLVMVEQFRHGSETVELELPGGVIDPHEQDPVAAGLRELREETGYTGCDARLIGQQLPNPAIMGNVCYTVVVEAAHPTHPTELDHGEDIVVRRIPIKSLPGLVAAGRIRHGVVLAALLYFDLWVRNRPDRA